MKTQLLRVSTCISAAALIMLFAFSNSYSQILITTASSSLTNCGTITFTSSTAQWMNCAPISAVANGSGTIVFQKARYIADDNYFTDGCSSTINPDPCGTQALGVSAANRVPFDVIFAASTGSQPIPNRYYSNLYLSSGVGATGLKIFNLYNNCPAVVNAVYVSGIYSAGGADRDYDTHTSRFVYDGSGSQNIFAENGNSGSTNHYYNLEFQNGGTKTLQAAQTNRVWNNTIIGTSTSPIVDIIGAYYAGNATTGATTEGPSATLTATGGQIYLNGSSASFNGEVAINSSGLVQTTTTGSATFAGTTDVNSGTLSTSVGQTYIAGTTNVNAGGIYDVAGTNSTVLSGGSLILANSATALLNVASSKTLTITGTLTDLIACGTRTNLNFAPSSFELYNGATGQAVLGTDEANPYGNLGIANAATTFTANCDIAVKQNFYSSGSDIDMSSHTLTMMDPAYNAYYASTGGEVWGLMKRYISSSSSTLTYNNAAMKVGIPTNPASVTWVAINNQPSQHSGISDYQALTDVNRQIRFNYASTAADWNAYVQYSYKNSEIPSPDPLNANESTLRYREVNGASTEKIATGQKPTRTLSGANFGYVGLANVRPTGGSLAIPPSTILAEVTSGDYLYLRGGPTQFITIANGRWSDPGTWDEGSEPTSVDVCIIKHTVHAGYARTQTDGNIPAGQILESSPQMLASQIDIADNTNGASLILANPATYYGLNPSATTGAAHPGRLTIGSLNGALTDSDLILSYCGTVATGAGTGDQNSPAVVNGGLYVFCNATLKVPENIVNNGVLKNCGHVEIGQ
ncbi:MAG: hypothetical protein NT007_11715 [Candidatus Kapabacteria bacterium]|nr:hypothetical protein [Candidatus Kapabacteria bacterium]